MEANEVGINLIDLFVYSVVCHTAHRLQENKSPPPSPTNDESDSRKLYQLEQLRAILLQHNIISTEFHRQSGVSPRTSPTRTSPPSTPANDESTIPQSQSPLIPDVHAERTLNSRRTKDGSKQTSRHNSRNHSPPSPTASTSTSNRNSQTSFTGGGRILGTIHNSDHP